MPLNQHHFVATWKDLLSHPKIDPTLVRDLREQQQLHSKLQIRMHLEFTLKKHSYAVYDIQNFWKRLVPEDHNQHDTMSFYLRSNTLKVKSRKLR